MSSKNQSSKNSSLVPFFVLNLEGGTTKALFTVPSHLADTLIQHPVLCRGAAFELRIDNNNNTSGDQQDANQESNKASSTRFLATEFVSPHPEATAEAISERLTSRITDSCESPLSTIFGF